MSKKSPCFSCKHKNVYEPLTGCFVCNFSGIECKNFEMYEPKSQTNADNIRAMTDEELAAWLEDRFQLPINGLWIDWLRQEAE